MKKWITITNETLPKEVAHPLQTDAGLAYYMWPQNEWRSTTKGLIHPTKYMEGSPEMFTLDDMIDCYNAGWVDGSHDDASVQDEYFKTKYNIEL